MKIGQYKQALKYMTRPGTPEQKKKAEENNAKYLADRRAKTLKEYGLTDHVVGTLNKFEDAPNIKQPKKVETKPTNGGPDILRNILIEEMKSRELDRDEIRYLMDTKDRSSYPKEATPEQVGKLAETMERARQMNGGDGRYDKPKPKPKSKPIVKKDPITNYKDFKIDPIISDPYSSLPPEPNDPYLDELEARVKANQELNYQEKVRNNSTGLRFFDPIEVKRDD
jgi:hypothetical protein